MDSHAVSLPHPDKAEPTVGSCRCGWTVIYGWGGHGDAAVCASEHIESATHSEPVETSEMSGDRMIFPGRSL